MRHHRHVIAIVVGSVLLTLWLGTLHLVLAQDYGGGGGTGTSVLSFDPQTLAVKQGGSASAKVTVKLASGKTWGTNLQAAALPTGVTATFDPVSGDPPFTSTMAVKATSAAAPGVYMVRVWATGDDPSPVVQYKVTVEK